MQGSWRSDLTHLLLYYQLVLKVKIVNSQMTMFTLLLHTQ
jgi:hypothetical protein